MPRGTDRFPRWLLFCLRLAPSGLVFAQEDGGGTLTLSRLDSQVPVGDGSVSTRGATGSIDADVAPDKHGTIHVSGPWTCHMPMGL